MSQEKQVLNMCRYYIDDIIVTLGNGEIKHILSDHVININIIKDFENNLFPILVLDCITTESLAKDLFLYKDKNKFLIKIDKFSVKNNIVSFDKKTFSTPFIYDTFTMLADKDDVMLDDELDQMITNNNTNEINQFNTHVKLYLFIENHITRYRAKPNKVLLNTTMTGVIGYLAKFSELDNVLLSPLNNTETYEEILLLPYTFLGNLDYFQRVYGLYEKGLLTSLSN